MNVNGSEVETQELTLDASEYLISGDNTISITVKANFNGEGNSVIYSTTKIVTLTSKFPIASYYLTSIAVENDIYVFSGLTIYKFDTVTETTTTVENTLPQSCAQQGLVLIGDTIYSVFGYYGYIQTFNTKTLETTSITSGITGRTYPAVAVVDNDIYILGGTSPGGSSGYSNVYKFDTITQTITTLDNLPKSFSSGSYVETADSVYMFSGYKNNNITKFDKGTKTTTTLDATPFSKYYLYNSSAALIGDNAYIFGGYSQAYKSVDTIYKFNITNESIECLNAKLPSKIYNLSATAVGEKAYLFGGYIEGVGAQNTILKFTV